MAKMVFGLFTDSDNANSAIQELADLGYTSDQISVVVREDMAGTVTNTDTDSAAENAVEGAVSGGTTGAILGGIAGLLIGVGAITIPGIGALLIGGPIAAALGLTGAAATTVTGALTGALAGGFVGALVNLGIPREDAQVIEERVREGAIFVATAAETNEDIDTLKDVFETNGAEQVSDVHLKAGRTAEDM